MKKENPSLIFTRRCRTLKAESLKWEDAPMNSCPELKMLGDTIGSTVSIPKKFLKHAKNCGDCRILISFALAAEKACATVERIRFSGCEHHDFKNRLSKLITEFIATSAMIFDPKEKENFPRILSYLYLNDNWCELCKMYFQVVSEKTFCYWREYSKAIAEAREIHSVNGKPRERTIPECCFIIPADSKPN